MRIINGYRCDESMKRSKEQCKTPDGRKWRCEEDCKNCICCLMKDATGEEHHNGANKWKQKNILIVTD